jgi:hypothetical protein
MIEVEFRRGFFYFKKGIFFGDVFDSIATVEMEIAELGNDTK